MNQKQPVVLFVSPSDPSGEYAAEEKICGQHFVIVNSRMKITGGDLVIGRYSVLPMYRQLEADIKHVGGTLVNSYRQHQYVADLQNWYADIEDLTFPTWFNIPYLPDNCGPVVVKGATNSKKDRWNTHMFANNKQEAIQVSNRLLDTWIGEEQTLYARKYVPLVQFATSFNEQPITLEYRFFCLYGKIMASGYYWAAWTEELKGKLPVSIPTEATQLVEKTLERIKENVNFVVVDVALAQNGVWYVVELNDGQMSGLSDCDPNVLYSNMKHETWGKHFKPVS